MVTGASSGIGEAVAIALAEQGAKVALVARRADRLGALAAKIADDGQTALPVVADITDADQAAAAVRTVVDTYGRLDVLVNNAGIAYVGPVAEAPLSQWQEMVAVNVNGVLYCTHAALPHLLKAAEGDRGVADIVTVSSGAGRIARPGFAVYAATKHAVNAFTESMRQELGSSNVRAAVVEPGVVATELTTDMNADFDMLTAGDIANAVTYMVTLPARAMINELLIRPTQQR
jgi:NADP-dependent 3-hydroxy acid dehydrogenase YdfG